MIRVFLLDDHEIVRQRLADLLRTADDIEVVGESGSATDATRRITALRPDVAIFDARLSDGRGIDVCRDVRAVDPTIKGLILTAYEDDDAFFAAMLAGCSGFLLKKIRGTDLQDAVRRIAAGESLLDPAETARVLAGVRERVESQHQLTGRLGQTGLTEQERRMLSHLAEGLTDREIATKMFLAEKSVRTAVATLLEKLGLDRRSDVMTLAGTTAAPALVAPSVATPREVERSHG